jgi:hypothetical protein
MNRTALLRAFALGATALACAASCNEIAGIKAGEPIGSPVDCEQASDCPAAAEPECSTLVGCQANKCAYSAELDGKVLTAQVKGDCTQRVCDGKGGVRLQAFDEDVEDDGKPCTLDTCQGGLPVHTPQQNLPCYSGPAGTAGVGECKQGMQHCDANFEPVGGCVGEVLPQPETCLTPGDEDCNGKTNEGGEGCVCAPSAVFLCYDGPKGTAGVGACKQGTCLCNSAGTACETACMGQVLPAPKEDCSTPADDDCDGQAVDPEDGCLCVANQATACYTGPAGTEGVGLCQGGMTVCDATGKGYAGPCSDVVPKPADDCTTSTDDDCDGKSVASCAGTATWVKASTTTGPTYANSSWSIASDAAGNLYAAGVTYAFGNTIDLGGGPLTPSTQGTGYAAFVVKLAPDGTHLWSKLLPCADYSNAYTAPHLALAGTQVAVAYDVQSYTCDFGSGTAASTNGIAVTRLDASTGAFAATTVIGNGNSTHLYAFGGAASGALYLAGYQTASAVTIGGVSLSNQPFVVKVGNDTAVAWAKGFALSSPQSSPVQALAVLPDGAVAFAGNATHTTINLGSGAVGSATSSENHYFAVLEPTGSLRWGKVMSVQSGSSGFGPIALTVTPGGDIVALGNTYGGLTVGAVTIPFGGYVGRLAAADGSVQWAKQLGMNANDNYYSLSVDVLGHIGIGGQQWATNSFTITSLDGTGTQLWQKSVPLYSGYGIPVLLAPARDAGLLFAGVIYGGQSFDGIPVSGNREFVFGHLAP